ncbi:MAG: O-antigen ligase family protein [Solirubrobacteraceae bacterium]|nr:O-antigen ligase family protein [Solirubrobacteraceae bacterium]
MRWSAASYRASAWLSRSGAGYEVTLAVPGVIVVAVFAALALADGGTREISFYPATLGLVLLLAAIVLGRGAGLRSLPRATVAALALLGAFVAWSAASVLWADSRGAAWEGTGRTLLCFAAFAVFALWPWRARAAAAVLGLYGIAIAVIGIVVVAQTVDAAIPASSFVRGRLADPTGYPNGTAALFLGALWPLIWLTARRDVPWPLRGITLAGAGALVQLALLAQSRGSLAACAVALALYLALVEGRVRTLLAVVPIAAVTWWSAGPLLDVFAVAQIDNDLVGAALEEALSAILASTAVLFAIGTLVAVIDTHARLSLPRLPLARVASWRAPRVSRRGIAVVGIALALSSGAAAFAVAGNPFGFVQRGLDEFTAGATAGGGTTHFGDGLRTARSQFWSVAIDELGRRPLTGMGSGNFAIAYARLRDSPGDEPRDAHSFPVEVASQTGLVGSLLLIGFLVAAVAGGARGRRGANSLHRGVAGVALVSFGYWVAHAAGDWLWAMPAVAAPAFAWLGMAAGLAQGVADPTTLPDRRSSGRRFRIAVAAVTAVALVATAAVTIRPWLAAEHVDFAARTWTTDLERAYEALERAGELNPFSDEASVLAGTIASRRGERSRARAAFARAVERTPEHWYAQQMLGIEQALIGRRAAALARLERARRLNPLEPTTIEAIAQVRRGERPSPAAVRAALLARVCGRLPTADGCGV